MDLLRSVWPCLADAAIAINRGKRSVTKFKILQLMDCGYCAGICDRPSSAWHHQVSMQSSCPSSCSATLAGSMDILKLTVHQMVTRDDHARTCNQNEQINVFSAYTQTRTLTKTSLERIRCNRGLCWPFQGLEAGCLPAAGLPALTLRPGPLADPVQAALPLDPQVLTSSSSKSRSKCDRYSLRKWIILPWRTDGTESAVVVIIRNVIRSGRQNHKMSVAMPSQGMAMQSGLKRRSRTAASPYASATTSQRSSRRCWTWSLSQWRSPRRIWTYCPKF